MSVSPVLLYLVVFNRYSADAFPYSKGTPKEGFILGKEGHSAANNWAALGLCDHGYFALPDA